MQLRCDISGWPDLLVSMPADQQSVVTKAWPLWELSMFASSAYTLCSTSSISGSFSWIRIPEITAQGSKQYPTDQNQGYFWGIIHITENKLYA